MKWRFIGMLIEKIESISRRFVMFHEGSILFTSLRRNMPVQINFFTKMIMRISAKISYIRKRCFPTGFEIVKKQWDAINGDATLRVNYPLEADSIVFDVGGYQGDWANAIHKRYGCSIHVFEPIPSYAQKIEERFSGIQNIYTYHFGLSGVTKNERIFIQADGTSVFKQSEQQLEVSFINAATFIKERSIEKIHLMKINIEGGEYELLPNLFKAGLLKKIDDLQIQFHDFVPNAQKKRNAIHELLMQTHHMTYSYPFVWENWKRNEEGGHD